jgi:hypothetical protein
MSKMEKVSHWIIYLIGLFLFMVAYVHLAYAQVSTPLVSINEVFPAPGSGNEWIELYNPGATEIDISKWTAEDQLTTPSIITTFADGTKLAAHGFLVFEVSNKLNNGADGVTLKNSTGQIIDQMSYTSSQTEISWARQPDGTGLFALVAPSRGGTNPVPSPSPTPTPSPSPSPTLTPSQSPSPTPTPTPTASLNPTPSSNPSPSPSLSPSPWPSQLQPSEIQACPETGEDEWIEIYNPESTTFTITNWKFHDSVNNTRSFTATLPAQSYTAINLSTAMLNNDGDEIILERPDGVHVFSLSFDACQKGSSYIFVNGSWQLTTSITKNAANIFTSLSASSQTQSTASSSENYSLVSLDNLPYETLMTSAVSASSSSSGKVLSAYSEAKSSPFFSPYNAASLSGLLQNLTIETSTASATTTEPTSISDSPPQSPHSTPKLLRYILLIIPILGLGALAVGGYGLYQCYTELYAEKDLEMV